MPLPEWFVRSMSKGEMNADPVEGEFFTPEGLAAALVREAIQNSLDAKNGGDRVTMRIGFSGAGRALPPQTAKQYTGSLWPCLETIGLDGLPSPDEPMKFVVVEDLGTRGLRGDPRQDSDETGGIRNDFYYFWRNIGRSSKKETERGRWGLGKTVFPASSRINAFFGLTVRQDDHRRYLMGQAVLKIHKHPDKKHCPYGYFARPDEEGFALPIEDQESLDRFCADFGLKRRNEPGLSIVIPYVRDEEIRMEEIERAVVTDYFYPILANQLEVEIEELR